MAALLVVDGHNVIFRSERYSQMHAKDRTRAREAFVRALASFGSAKRYRTVVVFDSGSGGGTMRGAEESAGVEIRYARGGETADEVIEELLGSRPRTEPAFVVSSDRAVATSARTHGAVAWSAEALLAKMSPSAPKRRPADWHPIEHGLKGYTGED